MESSPGQNFVTQEATLPQAPKAHVLARLTAFLLATPILVVLGLACYLTPSIDGFGTHTQLGLRKCSLLTRTGYPCPSCGFTTSFSLMAEGRIIESFTNQPMGATLSIFAAMLAILGLYIAATGSRVYMLVPRLIHPYYLLPVLGFFMLAWGYKIIMMRGGLF